MLSGAGGSRLQYLFDVSPHFLMLYELAPVAKRSALDGETKIRIMGANEPARISKLKLPASPQSESVLRCRVLDSITVGLAWERRQGHAFEPPAPF